MKGVVISVNVSEKKGECKRPVPSVTLRPDCGVVGDAHAGPGDRQVSLLAMETVEKWDAILRERRSKETGVRCWEQKEGGRSSPPSPTRQHADTNSALRSIGPGAFAENLTVRGLDLPALGLGTRLRIGREVVGEISKIGKECHTGCAIFRQVGKCPMPKEGIFIRVIRGGEVRPGDEVRVDANRDPDSE